MADTLVIVESPAKAKTIGKFLGSKFKVIACNGHVRDLPKSQLGVDVENDFEPKYITLRGKGEILERIRKEAKDSKKVYLATDPDREGEAISWHLCKILNIREGEKCRIEFNEITQAAVKKSIKNVRALNMALVDAQQGRRVLDRLVGYKISPILWAKVRKGLSAGRVQSVAARIICDREDEINAFIPEEYWTIAAMLAPAGSKRKPFEAKYYGEGTKKVELHSKEQTDAVLNKLKDAKFIVSSIKSSQKDRHASPPFTTSGLQQEASRKLSFTTKRTMMVAQQLYEGVELSRGQSTGLITYMRTDSVRVASEAQQAAREFIASHFGKEYVPEKPNFYKGRGNAQDAHEAIRPTHINLEPKDIKAHLTGDQYKLYKLIYERFVASQMSDAKYLVSTVSIDANGSTFRANGSKVLFDGFTAVYQEGRDDATEQEITLPPLNEGDELVATKIVPNQKFTLPPPRFTEATLVKTLEEKGIGRPSTYAPTISTIVDRGYVAREKKLLVPTELGFIVTKLMKENFSDIVDIGFTASMEEQLDSVEEGNAQWKSIVSTFYEPFDKSVQLASANVERVVIQDEVSDVPCDKCGAMMLIKNGRFGKFLGCPNFPTCRNTKPILEKINVKCPKCGGELVKKHGRKRNFYGCENYPACDFSAWDKPVNKTCEKCGSILVQKSGPNGRFIACSQKGCDFILRPKKAEANE